MGHFTGRTRFREEGDTLKVSMARNRAPLAGRVTPQMCDVVPVTMTDGSWSRRWTAARTEQGPFGGFEELSRELLLENWLNWFIPP